MALFVDEAHDLHGKTLTGSKRLMEVIARGGGNLPVILVGHPKLRNDLCRPTMEEIGHRTDILSFEGLDEDARAYLEWLLDRNYPATPAPINSLKARPKKFSFLSVTCQPICRASNGRPNCWSKARWILHPMVGIQ